MSDTKRIGSRRDRDEVARVLESRGITPTQQRIELAAILLARPQHLSAEALLRLVNRRGATVSKATVYNTLGLFARRGLVREVIVDRAKVFYDSNTSAHHHFYDISTGKLTDIRDDQIELHRLPAPPPGTELDGIEVIVRIRHTKSE